ncbi:MAG TPA: hypothetical protein VFA74_18070 [Terriglobales bacterium]|nr:hypothetical protein [Terriglobales bacterium]
MESRECDRSQKIKRALEDGLPGIGLSVGNNLQLDGNLGGLW